MSSITKFGVFLTLAAVLAILFAVVPEPKPPLFQPEKPVQSPQETESAKAAVPWRAPSAAEPPAKSSVRAPTAENKISNNLRVPAIRGTNHYGWVELPRGTQVSLVRESGDGMWVRWDGNVMKVPSGVARSGAVVVR